MSADGSMQPWGSVRWAGPDVGPIISTDGFRVWRWTDDDLTHTGLSAGTSRKQQQVMMERPPGTDEPGYALFDGGAHPVLALGRNPAGSTAAGYEQRLLWWQRDRWAERWMMREDGGGAHLLARDGTGVGKWTRRTRGRFRDGDRFELASGDYRPSELKGAGRWQVLTGIEVSDDRGPVLRISGSTPLGRGVDQVLGIESARPVEPELWALTMGALTSVWDCQVAAIAG